ncbi:Cytohesin-2 [Hondaea fermentalgiana]|uniref:Cytohesin-2 n=1 Tax=Hondaea fermentalgiana TaxID=2315210 RepID=A0A2R5GSB7_9STRA|nr:Cytohesin-2 [Hondaea fermentalgiana]|eukprot:GBG33776.1 Cytohesin-2 [Hondaea fermentalgiana]
MSFFFRRRKTTATSTSRNSTRTPSVRSNVTSTTGGGDEDDDRLDDDERVSVSESSSGDEGEDRGIPEPEVLGGDTRMSMRSTVTERDRRGTLSGMGGSFSSHHSRERSNSESLVRSGFMMKKGVVNQAYKRRWFVLTTKSLMYFDDQPSGTDVPKGVIPLVIVSQVNVKDASTRERINVVTPTRVYKLKTDSSTDADAWIAAISGAVEIEKKMNGARSRRSSLSMLDTLRMQDGELFPADTRIHTPAEISKWESWSKFEVAAYLTTFGMAWHAPKFFNAGINGAQLRHLASSDLEAIGVKSRDDQLTILRNISGLVKGEIAGSGPPPSPKPRGHSVNEPPVEDDIDLPFATPMNPDR